ncbi:hypothetical protein llg_11780 [Luteolibacter sp. LG18]|nr:hypothetical protein llg_11780 [Luteolibacter sp. LG18]
MGFGIVWTLFSSIFLVVGLLSVFKSLSYLAWDRVPCVVERFGIRADPKQDPPYQADLRFRYTWDGREYTSDRLWPDKNGSDAYEDLGEVLETMRTGAGRDVIQGVSSACRVNPNNPTAASLLGVSGGAWGGLIFATVGGLFVLIGIGIMRMPARSGPQVAPLDDGSSPEPGMGRLPGIPFFAVFALVGLGMLGGVTVPALVRKFAARDWVEVPAQVIWNRTVERGSGEDRSVKRDFFYRYTFSGREYRSNRYDLGGAFGGLNTKSTIMSNFLQSHPAGSPIVCHVNPGKPWQAVVDREIVGGIILVLFPIPFTVVGVGGLFGMWWWPRYQRRLALKASFNLPGRGCRTEQGVLLSGGTKRLTTLLGIGFAAIFWNSIVGVFVSVAVSEWRSGRSEVFLNLFLIPFVAVGTWLLLAAFNRLLQFRAPTYEVRLLPGPMAPGDEGEFRWCRREGKGQPLRLSILLIGVKSSSAGDGHEKVAHRETLAEIQQPGDGSLQAIRIKLPVFQADGPGKLIWKIRFSPRMASWLPAVPEDLEIPVSESGRPGFG